jgi:hypothetical protein
MIIFVECTIVDLAQGILKGKINKSFEMIDDFNKWYNLAKADKTMVINVMRYNPMEKPSLKLVNDVKLLQVSREFSI